VILRTKPIYPLPITFDYDVVTRNGKRLCRARAATVEALLKKHGKQNTIRVISENVVEVSDRVLIQKFQQIYRSDMQRNITRKNRCVACGEENLGLLTVHHVVPRHFALRLPKQYCGDLYHDKLCLCVRCHIEYEKIATHCKKEFADMFSKMFIYRKYGELILWWRSHFVETVRPKYLPEDFKVNMNFGKRK